MSIPGGECAGDGARERPSFRPDQAACGVAALCSVTRAPPAGARTVSQPMPATGSGRDAMPGPAPGDCPVPARVAPRPPAGGRTRSPAARPPRPGCRDVGTVRARPSPALSPPWPGCRCPGTGELLRGTGRARSRSCGDGHPRRASQASSHVRPCRYRCGPVRRSVPRLRRSPGSDGHPREVPAWPGWNGAGRAASALRAAVSPHRRPWRIRIFSN